MLKHSGDTALGQRDRLVAERTQIGNQISTLSLVGNTGYFHEHTGRMRIDAVHRGYARPNRSLTRWLQALMSRSATMPMQAVHRPAIMPRPESAFDRAVKIS